MIVRGAILNDRVYRQAYELFSRDTLEITHFENTCVKGTITATEDGRLNIFMFVLMIIRSVLFFP